MGARPITREGHARERDGDNGRRSKLTARFKRRYLGNGGSYRRGLNGILKGIFLVFNYAGKSSTRNATDILLSIVKNVSFLIYVYIPREKRSSEK